MAGQWRGDREVQEDQRLNITREGQGEHLWSKTYHRRSTKLPRVNASQSKSTQVNCGQRGSTKVKYCSKSCGGWFVRFGPLSC